ncbi:MAG: hypothetical protein LBM69_02995 [Lachnospiraceae bacterium]|nr:hypothetical protein [Lachnospiraceae bacterium]
MTDILFLPFYAPIMNESENIDSLLYRKEVINMDEYLNMIDTIDTDGDGVDDTYVYEQSMDLNGDGIDDVTVYRVEGFTDTDGDGIFDTQIVSEDSDYDGVFDTFTVLSDLDDDGNYDDVSILFDNVDNAFDSDLEVINLSDYNQAGGVEPGSYYDNYENFDPENYDPDRITGDPGDSLQYWELQEGNSCALHSQRAMIEELTGRDLSIEQLEDIGIDNGVYDPTGGTNIEDLSYMLDHFHVNNSGVMQGGSLDDLIECLDGGGKVLVGLDANQIWNEPSIFPAGHAVEVIGYDAGSDPFDSSDDSVIINDSGHPDGEGAMVPVVDFMKGWNWSGNVYVEAYTI